MGTWASSGYLEVQDASSMYQEFRRRIWRCWIQAVDIWRSRITSAYPKLLEASSRYLVLEASTGYVEVPRLLQLQIPTDTNCLPIYA